MCVENVVAKSCGSAGRSTNNGCSDRSPCVTVGHHKKMQQFQKMIFRVFSFRNTRLCVGDFQVVCTQFIRLTWSIQTWCLGGMWGLDSKVKSRGFCGSFLCCLCLCGTQCPHAQLLLSCLQEEIQDFSQASQFPARACLCNCIYNSSPLESWFSAGCGDQKMKARLSSSLPSSLLAAAVTLGGRRPPALSCLTVGRWVGCTCRLQVLQSPCKRGTEHRLNKAEFPALSWIPCEP